MDARIQKHRMMRWLGRFFAVLTLVASYGAQGKEACIPASSTIWCSYDRVFHSSPYPPNCVYPTPLAAMQALTNARTASPTGLRPNDGTYLYETTSCNSGGLCWYRTTVFTPQGEYVWSRLDALQLPFGCSVSSLSIAIAGGDQIEPSKGSTINNLPITATVVNKSNNNQPPTTPVKVRISLKVDPNSGGHDHGDSTRPRGSIENKKCESDAECWSGMTDTSGKVVFNFKSPEAAGIHTITATCDGCTNNPQTKDVNVKVEGLVELTPSQFYTFIGETDKHSANHYLKPAAIERLLVMAINYRSQQRFKVWDWDTNARVTPSVLHVNDASLMWGGRFDIKANWTNPHITHMHGIEVDIRANDEVGAIDARNFKEFEKMLNDVIGGKTRKAKYLLECTVDKPGSLLKHERKAENLCISRLTLSPDTNRHYHIRLIGAK